MERPRITGRQSCMHTEGTDARFEFRELPSVDLLEEGFRRDAGGVPRELLLAWVREVLTEARAAIRTAAGGEGRLPATGRAAWVELLSGMLRERLDERRSLVLRPVVNATGVLIHTNLGRAPLSAAARSAILGAAGGYCSLEMDMVTGRRRSRLDPVRRLLPLVTGAEAGIAVHNNAAAVFLVLNALARGRDVLVSRGHLVEIGGSFRLPEIMEASGANLVEVGSTNRTRISDYERALSGRTALILLVHPSNFRMIGFTEEAAPGDIAALGRSRGIPTMYDVGSGALRQHGGLAEDEPRVQDALEAGIDLVSFSGDKLLGGPQAGIVVGRSEWVDRLKRHPVARVVRLDKAALAALEATLEAYLDPATAMSRVPVLALLSRSLPELELLAERIRDRLGKELEPSGWSLGVIETMSEVGGGSLPGLQMPSRGVVLRHDAWSPDRISRALRTAEPSVAGRIEKDQFFLDVRALLDGDDDRLAGAVDVLLETPGESR